MSTMKIIIILLLTLIIVKSQEVINLDIEILLSPIELIDNYKIDIDNLLTLIPNNNGSDNRLERYNTNI
jgi:hypothetical protein